MRTIVLFTLLTVAGTKDICAQKNYAVSKKEVSAFLNWLHDSTGSYRSLRVIDRTKTPPDLDLIRNDSSTSKLFTAEDFIFMEKQARKFKSVKLNASYIQHASFLNSRKLNRIFSKRKGPGIVTWPVFYKKYGTGFCKVSYPLFNLSRDICIIYTSSMYGPLAGSGEIMIYKKTGNTWKLMEVLEMWVS